MLQSILRKSNIVFLPEAKARLPKVDPEPSPVHIAFENLRKKYPGENGVVALNDVSFTIRHGEIFGIIGRSGAGKSTLIRTINMLERPTFGKVVIDGNDIGLLDEDGLVRLRRKIGMIFQHFNLLSAKTVRDNVGLPLKVAGVPAGIIRERVDFLLDMVGLADKADVYPAKLSGGQKQRVGIARALVHDPEILLCDEATSALDPETTQSILNLLKDINGKLGLTIVLITHDMSVIRAICDKVLVLDSGNIAEQGNVWSVFGNPEATATRSLLAPLKQGLPDDMASSLQEAPPPDGSGFAIVSLRFTGESHPDGVSMADITDWAPDARLLHGGLDRIQGHSQGQLLVSIPAASLNLPLLNSYFPSDSIKVLGYVPDHV